MSERDSLFIFCGLKWGNGLKRFENKLSDCPQARKEEKSFQTLDFYNSVKKKFEMKWNHVQP